MCGVRRWHAGLQASRISRGRNANGLPSISGWTCMPLTPRRSCSRSSPSQLVQLTGVTDCRVMPNVNTPPRNACRPCSRARSYLSRCSWVIQAPFPFMVDDGPVAEGPGDAVHEPGPPAQGDHQHSEPRAGAAGAREPERAGHVLGRDVRHATARSQQWHAPRIELSHLLREVPPRAGSTSVLHVMAPPMRTLTSPPLRGVAWTNG